MTRWLMVLLLAAVSPAWAIDCTDLNNDGLVCLMSDNATQGGCSGGACVRTYTIPGNAARTGTGTISSVPGGATGSGTAFMRELHVGDTLTVSGQSVAITAIASDTSLSVSPSFIPSIDAGTVFTYTNPIVRWVNESGNTIAVLDARGLIAFGQAWTSNAMTIIGPAETAAGSYGKAILLRGGTGGPGTGAGTGGIGGGLSLFGGLGGPNPGTGPGGAGAPARLEGGRGGDTSPGSGSGGRGGAAYVNGAAGGSQTDGFYGPTGNVFLAQYGGLILVRSAMDDGSDASLAIDAPTGDITRMHSKKVSAIWTATAFAQANAGGM